MEKEKERQHRFHLTPCHLQPKILSQTKKTTELASVKGKTEGEE